MRTLTLVFTILLCSSALFAQGLSEQKLIAMKNAGVENALIVKQIEKDGISFQMDADTTIRLKRLGFAQDVLNALLSAGDRKASTAVEDPVKTLYAQGKYAELCDYLKSQLASNPTNYRLRAILIGSLLKIDEQPAALAELDKLKNQSQDPSAKSYADRASLLVSSWQKQQETEKKLLSALQSYNYADADSAIEQLPASDLQKQMLHMAIDSYAAKFDTALTRKSHLSTVSFSDKQHIDGIEDKIKDSEKQYKQLMDRVGFYLYSLSRTCYSSKAEQDQKHISIPDYLDVVSKLARLAPMSPEVMNLAFHAALLSTDYENLQAVGDKILAAKGTLEIPFYSKDRYFTLVVDTKLRSIYTRPDSHRFEICVVNGGLFPTGGHPSDHSDYYSELVAFNLPFDQIRSITQKAGVTMGVALVKHSYALSFEPAGVAPNYALMHWLYSAFGVQAGMQATNNLGQFVLHVIGNPTIKANLVDPKKTGSSGAALGDALVAMYGATHGNTPLGAMATQTYEQGKEMLAQQQKEQQANWEGMLAHDYSGLLDGSVFDSLDKLIESQ